LENSYTTEGGRGNWVFPRGGKQRAKGERQKPRVGAHSEQSEEWEGGRWVVVWRT